MNAQPAIRIAALAAALAAVTASAWAAYDSGYQSNWFPAPTPSATYVPAQPLAATEPAREPIAVEHSLGPNETVVGPRVQAAPPVVERRVAEPTVVQPRITVEQKRLSEDERIRAQVMDRLAGMRNISGKIGVESRGAVVRLTGYTTTAGQAWRAGNEAGRVTGVRAVRNEIRPRMGGIV